MLSAQATRTVTTSTDSGEAIVTNPISRGLLAASVAWAVTPALAYGPDGHHTVGALARELIKGTHAETEVRALLVDIDLSDAAVWADCAKGVDPKKGFKYLVVPNKYPECRVFETPERMAEMEDFVRRNLDNCQPKPGEEICHKGYHYTDIAIQRSRYELGPIGTRDDDVVAAIGAAMRVLRGEPAPTPFNIKNKREALLLLAHYVGDLHQPLHVGAVYLSAKGTRVDPDKGTYNPKTDTRGGNSLLGSGGKMHGKWDDIPAALKMSKIDQAWLDAAGQIAQPPGDSLEWPAAWATDTLADAKVAYKGLRFGALKGGIWKTTLPSTYSVTMADVKRRQITAAGAHLAQILKATWP